MPYPLECWQDEQFAGSSGLPARSQHCTQAFLRLALGLHSCSHFFTPNFSCSFLVLYLPIPNREVVLSSQVSQFSAGGQDFRNLSAVILLPGQSWQTDYYDKGLFSSSILSPFLFLHYLLILYFLHRTDSIATVLAVLGSDILSASGFVLRFISPCSSHTLSCVCFYDILSPI